LESSGCIGSGPVDLGVDFSVGVLSRFGGGGGLNKSSEGVAGLAGSSFDLVSGLSPGRGGGGGNGLSFSLVEAAGAGGALPESGGVALGCASTPPVCKILVSSFFGSGVGVGGASVGAGSSGDSGGEPSS
jgi:hypothetical protein